jgi:hypothetical protein
MTQNKQFDALDNKKEAQADLELALQHERKLARARSNRKARHQAMLDCGLVRVKGALGGTYYE